MLNKLLPHPFLYLITHRLQFSPLPQLAWEKQIALLAEAAQAGCQLIQIREKDLSARELARFVAEAKAVTQPFGTKVLVNDRLDVALATGADGIHLRTTSLPVYEVRRRAPSSFLLGVSTHSLQEAQAAEQEGADFIVCGPVFYTPAKAEYGKPLGTDQLATICSKLAIPVLALGGITIRNFSQCLQAGASGIAAISLFANLQTLGINIKMMLSSRTELQDEVL